MKRVISFGDSFTAGLGTDRVYEESVLGGHPDWDKMNDEQKSKQRRLAAKHRFNNCFTKFFADNFGATQINYGRIGCGNKHILNEIFQYDIVEGFKKDDFVLIGFTSSLRDELPYWPNVVTDNLMAQGGGITWSLKELVNIANVHKPVVWELKENFKHYDKLDNFMNNYVKDYIVNIHNNEYYDYYNLNLVNIIQKFLEYRNINYIMFDAFEPMFQNKIPKQINTKYYWEIGKKNIWSYLWDFNDESLYEDDSPSTATIVGKDQLIERNNRIHKHPSRKGHELFTKELVKFYESIYRI